MQEEADFDVGRMLVELDDVPDPYPDWARARRDEPVVRIADELLGIETFLVHSRADVESILRDGDAFSSRINDDTMGPYMGHTILCMDGDDHRRHRDLVARAFRASSLERWGTELIEPSISDLLDAI